MCLMCSAWPAVALSDQCRYRGKLAWAQIVVVETMSSLGVDGAVLMRSVVDYTAWPRVRREQLGR